MASILGYARVSTIGQDVETQLAALAAAGVDEDRIYTDKLSGAANTARPGCPWPNESRHRWPAVGRSTDRGLIFPLP
jgi:hypothetical protein